MSGVSQGRCWKIGHHVSNDQLLSSRFVFEYDLDILSAHCMEDVVPDFPAAAVAGDIVLAGRGFGHGSLHIHPFLAFKAMNVGVLFVSMPRSAFRLAVFAGTRLLQVEETAYDAIADGQELSIDFDSGRIESETGSWSGSPLSPFLQEIIEAGGGLAYVGRLAKEGGQAKAGQG